MDFQLLTTSNMKKYIDALDKMQRPEYKYDLGAMVAYYIGFFVPKKTGDLRDAYNISVDRDVVAVYWDGKNELPYSHYQYEGLVYGPNIAVFKAQGPNKKGATPGVQSGWVSPKGQKKQFTGRRMGDRRTIELKNGRVIHIDGYTTPGTGPEWIDRFNKSDYVKEVTIQGGRFLYEAYCYEADIKPVGGYQVLFGWTIYG